MLANQIDKDIQRIDVADIVGPVRDLDMGEISVKSGTPGFVTFVDVVNGWYHVLWWDKTCLVTRCDIALIK